MGIWEYNYEAIRKVGLKNLYEWFGINVMFSCWPTTPCCDDAREKRYILSMVRTLLSIFFNLLFLLLLLGDGGSDWEEGKVLAEGQNFARFLMESPANLMTPTIFTELVKEKFETCGKI